MWPQCVLAYWASFTMGPKSLWICLFWSEFPNTYFQKLFSQSNVLENTISKQILPQYCPGFLLGLLFISILLRKSGCIHICMHEQTMAHVSGKQMLLSLPIFPPVLHSTAAKSEGVAFSLKAPNNHYLDFRMSVHLNLTFSGDFCKIKMKFLDRGHKVVHYWAADLSKKTGRHLLHFFIWCSSTATKISRGVSVYNLTTTCCFLWLMETCKQQFGYFKFNESQQKQHEVCKPKHFYYFDNII